MSWWHSVSAGLRRLTHGASATATEAPGYLIFDRDDSTGETLLSRPVSQPEAEYLRDEVLPRLQPLSEEDYLQGPHAILGTAASFSYVLLGSDVYWCIEWAPGLLVVRFSATGPMSWCALRSPIPDFGGREASEAELDAYDEDAPNPQYNLVFDAWDPQHDPELRDGWTRASAGEVSRWTAAMSEAQRIAAAVDDLYVSDPEAYERWRAASRESPIWKGAIEL